MPNLARSIVRKSLRAQPDEPILITASPHTVDLATDVAVEAYRAGAAAAAVLFWCGLFRYSSVFRVPRDAPK